MAAAGTYRGKFEMRARLPPHNKKEILPPPPYMNVEKRILIVEDEIEILALIGQVLTKARYKAIQAPSPLEARTICGNPDQMVDPVLSDYNLPG
jgi:response regulator RpfG family c-di-GMP phosphodiesterase